MPPVGDWSDTTDFWTGTPPILMTGIKANTMFLNNFRLYKGAERACEFQRFAITYSNAGGGGSHYYSIRITDDCPWDRLDIIEKIKTAGLATIDLDVTHVGAEVMRDSTLGAYGVWTWLKVIDAYDITGWAAGNHLIEVTWWPSVSGSIDIKCMHEALIASLV